MGTNKENVKNWRGRLLAGGGRIIQVPLKKEDVERLERLKGYTDGLTVNKIIGKALRELELKIQDEQAKKLAAELEAEYEEYKEFQEMKKIEASKTDRS
jgi:hypothetical protein